MNCLMPRLHTAAWIFPVALACAGLPVRNVGAQQPPPPPVCEDTDAGGPVSWDLAFTPDPGVRVPAASLPKPFVDETGRVHLFYEAQTTQGGRAMYAVSDEGLTFAAGRLQQPADLQYHPFRTRMPNGVWRMYTQDPRNPIELRSNSSGDGVVFTGDAGLRYQVQPDDRGWMGVYDHYVDPRGRVVLLYLGDKTGLNNVRRAVSTDQGWTFTFARGDVLGDSADARTRGASRAFVDQKTTPLHDGRRRLFAMRSGCAIYSFVSSDGDVYDREPGARVTTTAFGDLPIRSLHDPVVVRLQDGRYRMYVAAALQNTTGPDGSVIVSATTSYPSPDPPRTPGPPPSPPPTEPPVPGPPPQTPARGWEELLERAKRATPARFSFAIDHGAEVKPTDDGRSFVVVWYPAGTTEDGRPPMIVTIGGHASWAFDDFAVWYPHLVERGYGLIALQWWFGGGETVADYYLPHEIYRAIAANPRVEERPASQEVRRSGD